MQTDDYKTKINKANDLQEALDQDGAKVSSQKTGFSNGFQMSKDQQSNAPSDKNNSSSFGKGFSMNQSTPAS